MDHDGDSDLDGSNAENWKDCTLAKDTFAKCIDLAQYPITSYFHYGVLSFSEWHWPQNPLGAVHNRSRHLNRTFEELQI